jgi:hypothetical protein
VLLLALGACRGKPQPSADFAQASERFNRLYGQKLDDAYAAPEMEEIEAQLARVPAESLDAPAAQSLLARIREGRALAAKQQADMASALREARTPTSVPPSSGDMEAPPAPAATDEPDAGEADAGTPGPQVGTPESELTGGFRGCFTRTGTVQVTGRGPRPFWELQGSSRCRLEYPALVESIVVVENAQVLMIAPRSDVKTGPADAGR